jgi:hypothetical protein
VERFIHDQNLSLFKRLLAEEPDMNHRRREMILQLLSEEEARDSRLMTKGTASC